MKKYKFLFLLLVFFVCDAVLAAPAPPPAGGAAGGPVCWPPPCVPVDNGLVLLMLAGALYGLKKIYDARKKTHTLS